MAEFITKKEHQRRLVTVVVCVVLDALALTGLVFSWKGAGDIENAAQKPETLVKLDEELRGVRRERRAIEQTYASFSTSIGWRAGAGGTAGRFAEGGLSGQQLRQFLDEWSRELTSRHGATDFKVSDSGESSVTLLQLFDKLKALEDQYKGECARLEGEVKAERTKAVTATADAAALEKAALDKIKSPDGATGLVMEYQGLLRELNTLERSHATELAGDGTPENAGLEGEAFAAEQKLTDLKRDHLRERRELDARKAEYQARKNWIIHRREEAKERKDPDGEILSVLEGQNIGYIDLVHSDRIFKGSRFRVYSLEKGGGKVDKGEIEVIEVREELSSRIAITKTFKADDPIRPGDQIYNELYERGKTRRIAVAGRLTGRLSNDEIARVVQEFGDVFQEKVDESTNYVILGEAYADSPNFKLAQEWGVKLMRENTLYDYLGVPHD